MDRKFVLVIFIILVLLFLVQQWFGIETFISQGALTQLYARGPQDQYLLSDWNPYKYSYYPYYSPYYSPYYRYNYPYRFRRYSYRYPNIINPY